jgi:hypothetical protein
MAIPLSSLPPELRGRLLKEAGMKPSGAVPRRSRNPSGPARFGRVCSCLCVIFRPDGNYPEGCDGCGKRWPDRTR